MDNDLKGVGGYFLIVEDQGYFINRPIPALGKTERPTVAQLNRYLPALGFPGRAVEFALFWVADDDPEMDEPVFVASLQLTMKWADYNLARTSGESFVEYLNPNPPKGYCSSGQTRD